MNDIFRDITGVGMAIIGVAILAVIVSNSSNTTNVVNAATSGFAQVLSVAMGRASGASGMMNG